MVTTNEKVQFDFKEDFGDSNYKSCFARSCVVNSQYHHSKSLDLRQLQKFNTTKNEDKIISASTPEIIPDVLKSNRKDSYVPHQEEAAATSAAAVSMRRLSCCSNSSGGGGGGTGRTSSRRGSDFPVENLALQAQVDTLQWQLKQAEASRQMYRAVMQQVVGFLERAHRSLDLFGERQRVVQRSRSEYHVAGAPSTNNEATQQALVTSTSGDGYSAFRDFTWRRPKRQQTSPDEIPPEKLSQEAFRLLRTAQSLLNTREPNLAHISSDVSPKDQEFLTQLANEFPSRPPPQRATSFTINPQLISPSDREIRISTAFNRKLSLQRIPVIETRRNSLTSNKQCFENDFLSTANDVAPNLNENKRNSSSIIKKSEKSFFDTVINVGKPPSPKTGSVSSAEDESGFSSMNSFQEVGLPLINSTLNDSDSLFKNGDISVNSSDSNITQIDMLNSDTSTKLDKSNLILWNRDDLGLPITHRRWSSTPVEVTQNDPLKVLWV